MLLSLDFSGDIPIYIQIRNQIVNGIASGALAPGERLPTIRALAEEAGINMMTVSKAYALLKQEGYIISDRRGGSTVAVSGEPRAPLADQSVETLGVIASEARIAGMSEDAFLAVCRRAYLGKEARNT